MGVSAVGVKPLPSTAKDGWIRFCAAGGESSCGWDADMPPDPALEQPPPHPQATSTRLLSRVTAIAGKFLTILCPLSTFPLIVSIPVLPVKGRMFLTAAASGGGGSSEAARGSSSNTSSRNNSTAISSSSKQKTGALACVGGAVFIELV